MNFTVKNVEKHLRRSKFWKDMSWFVIENVRHCLNAKCCEYTYARKEHLRNYLKNYQTSAFVCDNCNNKFSRKRHLKDHTKVKKLHTTNSEIKSA